jgi:stage V sporulation protein G
VEITEIWVSLQDKPRLKAFVNVTFDNAFVIRGMKVIHSSRGYFVAMPSRKRPDGTYQDVAHPVNKGMRRLIEERVLHAYEEERKAHSTIGS